MNGDTATSADMALQRIRQHLKLDSNQVRLDFDSRLQRHWPALFDLLFRLYGNLPDFDDHVEKLCGEMASAWLARSENLRYLDVLREKDNSWYQSNRVLGATAYVDLWSGNLAGLQDRIPALRQMGVPYLHLMPLFDTPEVHNDGGYAVSSYRRVRPDLGTMEQLSRVATVMRDQGISLVADFVFNHTSDEHEWAMNAKAGDPGFQRYYFIFPDRTIPDEYERTLREIFPQVRRGNFTWNEEMQKWTLTTFHSYQWDLNYSNPAVFRAMAGEMLFLANAGVEILRLDAVAFIWKCIGTSCENLPEAHMIIRAFNTIARIVAPAMLFKSEAIVHPDDVLSYISTEECQLSYNPLLMALLWEALATREVRLLAGSLKTRHALPEGCAWVNYLRSHDDIGWTFDDDDARRVGIDPKGHRHFLNAFYTGRFPGSFARGVPFQENLETGDCRISGTLASLAGLEAAHEANSEEHIDLAIARILLLHNVILTAGGIPLLYLGDELGQLNDYSYVNQAGKRDDSRWVHRIVQSGRDTVRPSFEHINKNLSRLVDLRKKLPVLSGNNLEVLDSGNAHVLALKKVFEFDEIFLLSNFSEHSQAIAQTILPGDCHFLDVITQTKCYRGDDVCLRPYQFLWLVPA